jgi:tetratricopeptide (TPR) repeat protein
MASLIAGYEYDIFISYRQKDNRGERWVSEFAESLKTELESTFKEEVSVYFDINPHDGLLATHDVNASLKEKLKCLVFIPVISRTYCDPKSFAWEHEFKAFIEQASKDQFGMKVKLPGGNVANRVLPVQIHDIDAEDKKLVETELGGYIRGIEFIYKEPGVNRPLKSDDDEKINLNKTRYRNQINKTGNAIKEIISGLKTGPSETGTGKGIRNEGSLREFRKEYVPDDNRKPLKFNKYLLPGSVILVLIIVAALSIYPKIFLKDTVEELRSSGERISVAVMPFQNMTNDSTLNVWQDGIQNELINNLSNAEELRVRQIESITALLQSKGLTNYTSITPAVANTLSRKLGASVFIFGSIKQAGAVLRVNAQIIDSKTEDALISFQIDGNSDNILHTADSLSRMVKNYLIISKLKETVFFDLSNPSSAKSPEAYRYFTYGQKAFLKRDYPTARNWLMQSIAIDSNFYSAIILLPVAYAAQGFFDEANIWSLKAYKKRDQMPLQQKIFTNWLYAAAFETPYERIKYLYQILEFDDQVPLIYFQLGMDYMDLDMYEKAIEEFEKSLEIYKKWETKPMWAFNYISLGTAYHKTGQYKKELKLYKQAEKDFPDEHAITQRQAILSLTLGDTTKANEYISKYVSLRKENSIPEAVITTNVAAIYYEASVLNKSEEFYRQALSLEPEKPGRLNNLAYFLIDNNINIEEGLKLADKALESSPDNYVYLDCKGWGLYKQGKYKEALNLLEKSWKMKPIYNHTVYLHLDAAKKAVAGLKN